MLLANEVLAFIIKTLLTNSVTIDHKPDVV